MSQKFFMVKVLLDIPTEKMQSFMQLMLELGVDHRSIPLAYLHPKESKRQPKRRLFHPYANKFLLFDWEFFTNELEYE